MSIKGFKRYGVKVLSVLPAIIAVISLVLSLHFGQPTTHAHLQAVNPVTGEDDIFIWLFLIFDFIDFLWFLSNVYYTTLQILII